MSPRIAKYQYMSVTFYGCCMGQLTEQSFLQSTNHQVNRTLHLTVDKSDDYSPLPLVHVFVLHLSAFRQCLHHHVSNAAKLYLAAVSGAV